jgi:predicted Fe-Mo cluster-binding NifX family protein
MKIAIPLFGKKVSPRFDLCPQLWVITVEGGRMVSQKKHSMADFDLSKRVRLLICAGINNVICGGIHDFCLAQLRNNGIEVLHNVMGEAEAALRLFLEGRLRCGSVCKKLRGQSRSQKRYGETGELARLPACTTVGYPAEGNDRRPGKQAHREGKYKIIERRLKDDPHFKTGY